MRLELRVTAAFSLPAGFAACLIGTALLLAVPAATAQAYPSKPIRFVVPSPPGGSPDILARIVGTRLSDQMKQQVIIDNRAGASGMIGVEIAKNAAADGYTLLLVTSTSFASLPALRSKLSYDAERDFIALSRIAWVANVGKRASRWIRIAKQ